VILPVLLTGPVDEADPLASVDPRGLEVVAGVLSAMRAHDPSLGVRLDHGRRQAGRAAQWPEGAVRARRLAAAAFSRSRLSFQVPGGATGQLAGALALAMVRETTASWDEALGRLRAWVEDHGDAAVPQGTKVAAPDLAAGTFALGAWCTVQRTLYRRGLLAPERARELEGLAGWVWQPREDQWWANFDALADYVACHGQYPRQSVDGVREKVCWGGWPVAQFLNECRTAYNSGGWIHKFPDRVAALEGLAGWTWNERRAWWEDHFDLLAGFAAREGHASPGCWDVVDGFNLGRWVQKERAAIREGRRDEDQVRRLRALPGWVDNTRDALWEEGYRRLVAWVEENGAVPPQDLVAGDGFSLGGWVCTQRERHRRGRLDGARTARLEAVAGWTWDPLGDSWAAGYERLRRYVAREGDARVPGGWVEDGLALGNWCGTKRGAYKRGALATERVAALEALPGWTWSVPDSRFDHKLAALAAYQARHGNCEPPPGDNEDGAHLGAWVARVRQLHDDGRLDAAHAAALEAIPGWSWQGRPKIDDVWQATWDHAYRQLEAWAREHGHASPPGDLVVDGRRLGAWVRKQRTKRSTMPAERIRRLQALPGWQWVGC
jgi:hypothetical protein